MLSMTNQSSPEYSSLLILQIYIFFTTVSKCHKNNGHSARCVGVLYMCCMCVITFVPEII